MRRANGITFAYLAMLAALAAASSAPSGATPTPGPTVAATTNPNKEDARATELLSSAMHARESISYTAQVEAIHFGPSGSVATIAREEHLAPDQTHKAYLAPQEMYGDSVIIHGADTFSYDTQHQRVVISHGPVFDAQTFANGNLALLLANYRPVIAGPEIVAGRPTVPCALVNRFTGERVMRVWIDAQTRLILQKETYHANGTIDSRTQFDNVRYTQAMPESLFATPVPAGYRVVDNRMATSNATDVERVVKDAGFAPASPRYLPEGFTLVSADVTTLRGVKTVHLMYSDGIRSLSLFENNSNARADFGRMKPLATKVENHDALYVNDGSTTFLAWKNSALTFALVGDLDLKELKAIAASVS
jgi:negative regulator of sigma E activity